MPKKSTTYPAVKSAPKARSSTARQVRIIGGNWKRTPLPVLDAIGLRPTPDRVRETVFNWLTHLFDGDWADVSCLDLFAGTGALGLEAASRGAVRVLLVEENAAVVRQLEMVKDKLRAHQVSIVRSDARSVAQGLQRRLNSPEDRFTLIFLDPPYNAGWLAQMLPLCAELLADNGVLYAEAEGELPGPIAPEWLSGWRVIRADKAGSVFFHLLQRQNLPQNKA